jgi:hypothetical protein
VRIGIVLTGGKGMAATDSPDTTTTTREAERQGATGGRFERPGAPAAAPARTTSGGATAAIVLGALGIVGGLFIPIIGLVLGIIGLVLGMSARRSGGGGKAAVIVPAVAIGISVANWIVTAIIITS